MNPWIVNTAKNIVELLPESAESKTLTILVVSYDDHDMRIAKISGDDELLPENNFWTDPETYDSEGMKWRNVKREA